MKIIYTSPIIEHPPKGGPFLRVENSIVAINKICELHLIIFKNKSSIGGKNAIKFFKNNCYKLIINDSRSNNNYIKIIPKFLRKLFLKKIKNLQSDCDYLTEYCLLNKIDIVWFGYGNISFELMQEFKKRMPNTPIVCDTDSVWSRFVLRKIPFIKNIEEIKKIEIEGKNKEIEEIKWVEFADVTTAVSLVDADYYKGLTENKEKIKIFSNVININNYLDKHPKPKDFKKPCIFFAGYFGPNSPTDIAARWVINDILPIVKKELPEIHFYIAGRDSDSTLNDINDSSITILGTVDSVLPYLQNSDIALVPLKFESGTRFKILEAGICEIPIVSTTLGAEGLEVSNDIDIVIADETQDFAQGIIKLLKNKDFSNKIAKGLKSKIIKNNSIQSHQEEALEIIKFIKEKNASNNS
jgi:glycosyltransferase involved in cell wall biosynthesis